MFTLIFQLSGWALVAPSCFALQIPRIDAVERRRASYYMGTPEGGGGGGGGGGCLSHGRMFQTSLKADRQRTSQSDCASSLSRGCRHL